MKSIFKPLLITLFFSLSIIGYSQNDKIYPPTEGKAVIYFLRTQNLGALMNFRFFEKDKFIGKFSGINYIRYECEPGKSVFWVKAENLDFIETDLEANKIYFIETNARMGAFSAAVKFKTVDFNNKKQMKRINKLFEKKDGVTFTREELTTEQKKKQDVINSSMVRIQRKRKTTKAEKVKMITPEMNYKMN